MIFFPHSSLKIPMVYTFYKTFSVKVQILYNLRFEFHNISVATSHVGM